MAAFVSTPSLGIPREHDDAEARANARLSVQLPYLFASCRIAHYIKAIVRDRFAASLDRQSVHRWLQDWIANYVDPAPGTADALTRWPKPLAAATVIVEAAEGNPDSLTAKVYIRLND
jgi:type VI secretion system protein ImpC